MDTLVDFLLNFYGPTPYLFLFGVLLLCGFGVPIPEDVTLFAGGLLAYYGLCNLWLVMVVCFAGVMIGDVIMWFLGRHFGHRMLRFWFFKRILTPERLAQSRERFRHTGAGNKILFAARFMPGLRSPMFFSAGLFHVPFSRFLLWDGLAALISVPTIVGAVFYFGDELDWVVRKIKKIEMGILVVIALVVTALVVKWVLHRRAQQGKAT